MAWNLVFPRLPLPEHLLSATDQEGPSLSVKPASSNVGALTLATAGTPADVDFLAEIMAAGTPSVATFRLSLDGGSTYLGRRVDTIWDGNPITPEEVGFGLESRQILADTALCGPSRIAVVDTDDDGFPDRAIIAVARTSTTPDQIDILYTDDMTGVSSWTTLASNVVTFSALQSESPALLRVGSSLYLFASATVSGEDGLHCWRSDDNGSTWTFISTVDTDDTAKSPDATLLQSGKICLVYVKTDSSYTHIYCKTSADGITWTTSAKKVTAAGSVNYLYPSVIQEADGKTVVFFRRDTATEEIQARQTTKADPAASATTWAAYSETLWSSDTTDSYPTAAIAPDGTIYVIFARGATPELRFTKFKDGDANYAASGQAYAPTGGGALCKISMVGGALWFASHTSTSYDIELTMARYWTAYDDAAAPPSYMGTDPHFLASGLWATWGGANGEIGDTYSGSTVYANGADRMAALRPTIPSHSLADEADWNVVFDLGATLRDPVDVVLGWANLEHCHVQLHSANTWTSPTVNASLSFVKETVASASRTLAVGKATRSSGTWTAHTLAGMVARFTGTGNCYPILANTETVIYCDADLTAESGDLQILSPKAWVTVTANDMRYRRMLIESQETPEGKYRVRALAMGAKYALPIRHRPRVRWVQPNEDADLYSGGSQAAPTGMAYRVFSLVLTGATLAEYQALTAAIRAHGRTRPMILYDDTNAFDWYLVHPPRSADWSPDKTTLTLTEIDASFVEG